MENFSQTYSHLVGDTKNYWVGRALPSPRFPLADGEKSLVVREEGGDGVAERRKVGGGDSRTK